MIRSRGNFVAVASSLALIILLSVLVLSLSVLAQSQVSNFSPGYVKYTLILYNNTLINGNYIPSHTTIGYNPVGIVYDPNNGYLYVTKSRYNAVSVIDGRTNTVIENITVGLGPFGVVYDPSNGYIYVTNYWSGTISVISTVSSTALHIHRLGMLRIRLWCL